MEKILMIASLVLMTTEAEAYQLRTTDSGEYIRWDKKDITVVLDDGLEALGPLEDVKTRIIEAFELWEQNAELEVSFSFEHGTCDKIGYQQKGKNKNCVLASNDASIWERNSSHDPGASAVVSYHPQTGDIVDGDIVFNSLDWEWSLSGSEIGKLDIRTVVTHEIGHMLGLDHSKISEAAMYPVTRLGAKSIAQLHTDDISAAIALYDEHWVNTVDTANDDISASGCSAVIAGGPPSFSFYFLGLLALIIWRRYSPYKLCRARKTPEKGHKMG